MTEAQRALVLKIYDAIGDRDLDELRRLAGPDSSFEWASASDEVDAGTRHGTDAAIAYFREVFELFDELHTVIEDEIDLSPEEAIFVVRHEVRGAASGAGADRREAHLWTFSGERVVSVREFPDVGAARRAARESVE